MESRERSAVARGARRLSDGARGHHGSSSGDQRAGAGHPRQSGHGDPVVAGRGAVFRHRWQNGTGSDRRGRPCGQPDPRCCGQPANQGIFALASGGCRQLRFRENAARAPWWMAQGPTGRARPIEVGAVLGSGSTRPASRCSRCAATGYIGYVAVAAHSAAATGLSSSRGLERQCAAMKTTGDNNEARRSGRN
jgi:hypothetical protein